MLSACFTREVPCPDGLAREGAQCLGAEADSGTDPREDASPDELLSPEDVDIDDTPTDDVTPEDCLSDVELCDGIDNDCDGDIDEGATNACGGSCATALPHELGSAFTNELQGACARPGVYVCDSPDSVRCNAPEGRPSPELCGDGIDNDCNGLVDEPTAENAVTWYQDCDADGFAGSVAGAVKGCAMPASIGRCAWTAVIPNQATATNWDCDDSSAAYTPAATYGTAPESTMNADLNCDGRVTPDPSVARTQFTPCAQNVLDWINKGGRRAWRTDSASNSPNCPVLQLPGGPSSADDFCTAWRDASGALVRDPPSLCPDDAVTLSWSSRIIDTSGGYTGCSVSKRLGALWPCR